MKQIFTLSVLFLFNFTISSAQLVVDTTLSPVDLVTNVLVGSGVTVSNITFNGSATEAAHSQKSCGEFSGTSSIGLANGVVLTTGYATAAIGPNTSGAFTLGSTALGTGGDPDLDAIATAGINDKDIIEFDFIPLGDSIKFKYVFGSEEYPEYVCSTFNDVFGFFLTGTNPAGGSYVAQNLALIPGTSLPVAINTVNPGVPGSASGGGTCTSLSYSMYYVNNPMSSTSTIQYDGYTVVLEVKAAVNCGEIYHIKLAIGDAGDAAYDSGVFLEAGSFSSNGVQVGLQTTSGTSTIFEGCLQGGVFSFQRSECDDDDTLIYSIEVGGNAINGIDYSPAIDDTIMFLPGQDSVAFSFLALADGITESGDSLIITVYNVNDLGDTTTSTAVVYIVDMVPMVVDIGPDTAFPCLGGNVPLSATVTGGYIPYSYAWSTGATTTSINPFVTSSQDIILTVNGLCGTTASDTMHVEVAPTIPHNWTSGIYSTYCPFDPVTIFPAYVSGGTEPFTYSWTTGSINDSITVAPGDTTIYSVTITDACNQDVTVNIEVDVRQLTQIAVSIASDTVCLLDGDVTIVPVVTGSNGNTVYQWWQTGVPVSNQSTLTVTQTGSAVYIVNVIDACGTFDQDTATIVAEPCDITIPNIITPNGDGYNNYFVITNLEKHTNTGVIIFNRWGQVMYENSNYQNNWDGGDVSDGVYFYLVTLTDGSSPDKFHGSLHIVRGN